MGGRPITPEERGRIHGYHECGFHVREIVRRMQRSTDAVRSVISPAPPHEAKPRDAWASTVFSAEKRFCLDGPDEYKDYWKDLRRPAREYVQRQSSGGSIMSSPDYIYTASECTLPFTHRHYGIDYVYQQDNASIHRSHATIEFFSEIEITLLEWPARSPDLNLIENVWAMMKRSIYQGGKEHMSIDELKGAILIAWNALSIDALQYFIEPMPRRCIEVIEKEGGKTHY